MNKTFQIGAALGAAALVVAGGSAFTAGNTQPGSAFMGSGSTAVSGVTVDNIQFTYTVDNSLVESVTFNLDEDLAGIAGDYEATLVPSWDGAEPPGIEQSVCAVTVGASSKVVCTGDTTSDLLYPVADLNNLTFNFVTLKDTQPPA